jgi:hypothetical protein
MPAPQDPTEPLTQLNRLCLSLTYIIDLAKIEGVITASERDTLWSAIWSMAGRRHTAEAEAQVMSHMIEIEESPHV